MNEPIALNRHMEPVRADLAAVVSAIAEVAARMSDEISGGPLRGALAESVGSNEAGDTQTALDVTADRAFFNAMRSAPVRWYASEERPGVEEVNPEGTLAVAMDPLDGSSNIECNVSIGTIFSISEAGDTGEESILRPGREQIAAGYIIYGPQTAMMLTLADGVGMFVLDRRSGTFLRVDRDFKIPEAATEFAINASNYRHWSRPIRAYIDDCIAGADGPRGKNFNMRWIASLVAETHRIMTRGGVFLYPADARQGYEHGRLRLVYECNPISLLVERAGGAATDTLDRILDKAPGSLHERTPFVFGSRDKVARVAAYHELPEAEVAPLFGRRGLFTG